MESSAPYLYAIQKVPGSTPPEKFKWLEFMGEHLQDTSDTIRATVPELLPFIALIEAIKKKSPGLVTLALQNEEVLMVRRALKASWYFDGSCKDIIDIRYLSEQLFNVVSLTTRRRVLKQFATHLCGRDPAFARQIFKMILHDYGIKYALPMLAACDVNYVNKVVVEKGIELSRSVAKRIYRRNPKFIIDYLKLSKPSDTDMICSTTPKVDIQKHLSLVRILPKKHLEDFVEIFEMHKNNPLCITLSNNCARKLLRDGFEYIKKKPQLYIKILPLKKFNVLQMEMIFPDILPVKSTSFDTDKTLCYLEHLPTSDVISILSTSYKIKYEMDLFDDSNINLITPKLMQLLPDDLRQRSAETKINFERMRDDVQEKAMLYETSWVCYLRIDEAITQIKQKLQSSIRTEHRIGYIWQMIYACKINNDRSALLDTLVYIKANSLAEEFWVFDKVMNQLVRFFDLSEATGRHWSVLSDMINKCFAKYGYAHSGVLIAMAHFNLNHKLSIMKTVEMLVETKVRLWNLDFKNMIKDNAKFEKKCLSACARVIQHKYEDRQWIEIKEKVLCMFVQAIYDYNDRYAKSQNPVEPLSITKYPWVVNTLRPIIKYETQKWHHICSTRQILEVNEPELYRTWYYSQVTKESCPDVTSRELLVLLKDDWQGILDQWETYLEACKLVYKSKRMYRFVRAVRWYKDIPIKFAENCMHELYDIKKTDKVPGFVILSILLHGDTLTTLIKDTLPNDDVITNLHDAKYFNKISAVCTCVKLSEPPVSREIIQDICTGEYFSLILGSLISISSRWRASKIIACARFLAEKRVTLRKHGIRLMCAVASRDIIKEFLHSQWQDTSHISIRILLLKKAQEIFYREKDPVSWTLLSEFISTLSPINEQLLLQLKDISNIPGKYLATYIDTLFKTIDNLEYRRMEVYKIIKYTIGLIDQFKPTICCALPEEFISKLLQRYLFHIQPKISASARYFAIFSYLLPAKETLPARISVISKVLKREIKYHWSKTHPRKTHFFPINNGVRNFVHDFVNNCFIHHDPEINDKMLGVFANYITPKMDMTSYLLVVYGQERNRCTSPKNFGWKLGERLPELLITSSNLSICILVDTLKSFLRSTAFKDFDDAEIGTSVAEGLIATGKVESYFLATRVLLPIPSRKYMRRYDSIIEYLKTIDHPAVSSGLHDHINAAGFHDTI